MQIYFLYISGKLIAGYRKIDRQKVLGLAFLHDPLSEKNALANECQWHRGIPQHVFCEDMPRKAIDVHLLRHTIPKLRVMKEGVKKEPSP